MTHLTFGLTLLAEHGSGHEHGTHGEAVAEGELAELLQLRGAALHRRLQPRQRLLQRRQRRHAELSHACGGHRAD